MSDVHDGVSTPADLEAAFRLLWLRTDDRSAAARAALRQLGGSIRAGRTAPVGDDADRASVALLEYIDERLPIARSTDQIGPTPPDAAEAEVEIEAETESAGPTVTAETDGPLAFERLIRVRDAMFADRRLPLLQGLVAPDTAADLWIWLHLVCLALPVDIATGYRRRLHEAADQPDEFADVLVPASSAYASAGMELPSRAPGPDRRILRLDHDLALLVTDALRLAGSIAPLSHTLEVSNDDPLRSLADPATFSHYRDRLLSRVDSHVDGTDDPLVRLIKLDEAIRSVVPIPLPMAGSWWTMFASRCDAVLRTHADRINLGTVKVPSGAYPVIVDGRPITKETGDIAIASAATQRPEVQWVLRAWYWTPAYEAAEGRVIYSTTTSG
jgi:hypothetical protein